MVIQKVAAAATQAGRNTTMKPGWVHLIANLATPSGCQDSTLQLQSGTSSLEQGFRSTQPRFKCRERAKTGEECYRAHHPPQDLLNTLLNHILPPQQSSYLDLGHLSSSQPCAEAFPHIFSLDHVFSPHHDHFLPPLQNHC